MRRLLWKRCLAVMMAMMMIFTAMPAFAWADADPAAAKAGDAVVTAQVVTPSKVNEAVTKFTDALTKFCADTSKLSGMSTFLTRFGGVTAAASGVIGILQMSGVIKDPTQQALGEILNTVHDIQTQLNQMDAKLDEINQQLVSVAVRQEEISRNKDATTMLKYWREFNTQYTEPLDDMIEEYQGKINRGIRDWWKQSHDGVRLLYTYTSTNEMNYALTYSRHSYSEGIPETADNGEVIAKDECIGLPAEYVPDTTKMTFNIDTYQEVFEAKLAEGIIQAIEDKKLEADKGLYQLWDKSTEAGRSEMAATYAHDMMNTLIYQIACDVMSNNDAWVISVRNAYKHYCDNVLQKDSGVNAMLNAMYLTHGFEGEIKTEIEDFCDQMAAKAGVYGQFALTCAGQDDMQSLASKEELQSLFTDTIISLYDRKDKALTGHDNYCYVTGTRIESAVINVSSTMTMKAKKKDYKGCSSTDWKIGEVPSILDNVYSKVLYDQYKALNQGQTSFSSYLKAYGALPADNRKGTIMTRYGGVKDFALSEGIRMQCFYKDGGNYFTMYAYYNINTGNNSDIENKYFHVHDKVVYDVFNMETGTLAVDQTAAARALYGESHWNWTDDEMGMFLTDGCDDWGVYDVIDGIGWDTYTATKGIDILKLIPVHNLNGDNRDDPEDPFLAFDMPSLPAGVSNLIGPTYKDTTTPITDVVLGSDTYTYTGNAIKPYGTVMAGKKKVPLDGFKVTYGENREIGYGEITVEGEGEYSGTIHKIFRIVPKGTALTKIKRKNTVAAVRWKDQTELMPDKEIDGYQIRYSTKKSMKGAKKLTVKGYTKTSAKIRKLKKNKKYYVQIRTYVTTARGNIYSKWSAKKFLKAK